MYLRGVPHAHIVCFLHPDDKMKNFPDLIDLLFYNAKVRKKEIESKIESKIGRLNLKTIRCDKKKWKDNVVLHYLISK